MTVNRLPSDRDWRLSLAARTRRYYFLGFLCFAISGHFISPIKVFSSQVLGPVVLEANAIKVMEAHCFSCHGAKKQKGKLRFDTLESKDPVDLQALYTKMAEVVQFKEMPPEDSEQPSEVERKSLLRWLNNQLNGEEAKALEEKLARFEYGNVTSHEDLFSGEYVNLPGYTPNRRWLISEFIFNEKINRLLNYRPTRKIYGTTYNVQGDSGVHWSPKTEHGNKFRRTITNPFLLPEKVGVRYSSHKRLTTGHLLTMVGNAKRVARHMASRPIMRAHYPAMYALMKDELEQQEILRSRENFLRTYSFMSQLLENIDGEKHERMLPEIVLQNIPYPGPPKHQANGIQKRHENLDFLGRFDQEDIRAILRGIKTYKQSEYRVEEITAKSELDNKGNPVWAPYSEANLAEYNNIIRKCERDWFLEGVTDYRISNRITTMKLFYDTWDMNRLYPHIEKGNFSAPKYTPLNETEMEVISMTIRKNRKPGDRYIQIVDKCLADWQAELKAERESTSGTNNTLVTEFVIELYEHIFEREPSDSELDENIGQFEVYLSRLDRQKAIGKLIESLVLSTEFAYRNEFGQTEADENGRRLMSPRNASYALAYALTDDSPDETLAKAAEGGKLDSRKDYEREVRRLLGIRDKWNIIDENVQAANLNPSVTNQPIRKLRFFREFFGYPKAQNVFKDDSRFGAGRHQQAVSRLIEEADMLVEHILKKDEDVFETLLTTDKFYIFHNGDNTAMKAASDSLKSIYDFFKGKDWPKWEPEDIAPHEEFLRTHWEFQREKQGDYSKILRKLQKMMEGLELHFSEGQTGALPYMKNGMGFWHGGPVLGRSGQQMRGEQVTTYWNLDWKTWDYPPTQPATIRKRKGILTHPAWLIAHAQNLETDPIHRGKWIREKLLAGTIPDVPITVDAVIPPDPHKTLRQRMENRTGESYCWRCHEKMDPLGFPFEIYDDFGRYRTAESLEYPENLVKEAKRGEVNSFGASLPVYKTLPIDPRGTLMGTGDAELDGTVKDAFDLIDRLARSEKVRQSIIRHAFRYFLGRNETVSDSKTLIDADKAYINNKGSFDEVIVSLLTSDSFIYRKPNPKK